MDYIFENNRTPPQQRIYEAAVSSKWLISDVFDASSVSDIGSEEERLKWAPVLASLAFGEATAFEGFGQRIADAGDISAKTWLAIHLLDEAKHTEGFTQLLNHLYPSYRGRLTDLLHSRDILVFYGRTQRTTDLTKWLICTQIAEIFGMHCYKSLHEKLNQDNKTASFFSHIIADEGRHIAYIGSLIDKQRALISELKWRSEYAPFCEQMTQYARNMFEAHRRGPNFRSFEATGIDVTAFCDRATSEIMKKIVSQRGAA